MAAIQKLAQVLAKVLKLKSQGDVDEALQLSQNTLKDVFALDPAIIQDLSVEDFDRDIKSKNYETEKLDLLAQFLFESVYPFNTIPDTHTVLHKVLVIYNILEREHHTLSMENFSRREMIDNFLNTEQYE